MFDRKEIYKKESNTYWNLQYQRVGWQTTHDAGGVEKTESLAKREIDLFLWPTQEKVKELREDKENNPFPTMTPDMHLHPHFGAATSDCVALDYGCGGLARYSIALASHFKFVYGVDISEEAIKMARAKLQEKKVKNALLSVCDGVRLNFSDNKFDFIFSNLVLQHIGNKEVNLGLAREFARCLKPGGMARLEYLHPSQAKPDKFFSVVEGNGLKVEELNAAFNDCGAEIVCHTEFSPYLWITVKK